MDNSEIQIILSIIGIVVAVVGVYLAERRRKRKAKSKIIKVIIDLDEKKKIVDVEVTWQGPTSYEVVNKGDEVIIKPKKE
jgi:hypothetical protein